MVQHPKIINTTAKINTSTIGNHVIAKCQLEKQTHSIGLLNQR